MSARRATKGTAQVNGNTKASRADTATLYAEGFAALLGGARPVPAASPRRTIRRRKPPTRHRFAGALSVAALVLSSTGLVGCRAGAGPTAAPPTSVPGAVDAPGSLSNYSALATPLPATATSEPTAAPTSSYGTIQGTVTDQNGTPLNDVSVVVTEGTGAVPQQAVYSDSVGRYQWIVPPGTYTLHATRDGFDEVTGEATVAAGASAVLDFQLTGSLPTSP
jgi:hypothetical protein